MHILQPHLELYDRAMSQDSGGKSQRNLVSSPSTEPRSHLDSPTLQPIRPILPQLKIHSLHRTRPRDPIMGLPNFSLPQDLHRSPKLQILHRRLFQRDGWEMDSFR